MSRLRAWCNAPLTRFSETRFPLLCVAALATVACGKEGPPLPPLHLVPSAVENVVVRRSADQVRFAFVLPTKNANGPGAVNLDRVEIYAATVAAGAVVPRNLELLTPKNLVGTIPVRAPAVEGGDAEKKPDDTRPGPGDPATFVEVLDAAKLTPSYTEVLPAPPVPTTPVATPPATAPAPVAPPVTRRLYVILGVARNGRRGPPAARIDLPLVDLPAAPTAITATFTETAVTLSWTPPTPAEGAVQFNVYVADGPTPLNAAPLAEPSFQREGLEFGKEECFVVRSVVMAGPVSIESAAPQPTCVTPADTFAPKAPAGLNTVAGTGLISLIWNANGEADLSGYLVLRGEAPGDTLQPLTPSPIKETTFRDTTVTPGVRYVYAVVAVDTAGNRSPQSPRVEDTAR